MSSTFRGGRSPETDRSDRDDRRSKILAMSAAALNRCSLSRRPDKSVDPDLSERQPETIESVERRRRIMQRRL